MAWTGNIQQRLIGTSELTDLERQALPRFLCGMVFQGVWWAGYILVPFVLAKSLAAPGGLITLAVMMDTGGMLLAIYWGFLLSSRHRRAVTFWGGILGRLVLVASLTVESAGQFVALLAVAYFFGALVYPAQNGILQLNMRTRLQGRIWGLGAFIQNIVAVATSLVVGRVLDRDPSLFGETYAVIGACGFVYLWVLARLAPPARAATAPPLPAKPAATAGASGPAVARDDNGLAPSAPWPMPSPLPPLGPLAAGRLLRGLIRPFADAVTTFRRDRGYLWYEANFMTYGLAFLMIYPMLPILFHERLNLNYQQISTARIVIASLGVAVLGPFMGGVMDRFRPSRLCQLAFGIIALYPIGLILADTWEVSEPAHLVYLAFAVYAAGMAGVNVAWNVGSIAFAPPGKGSHYQGIHVAMVGVRGLIGPAIGYAVYRILDMSFVFGLAALLFLLASFSSGWLGRWQRDGQRAALHDHSEREQNLD